MTPKGTRSVDCGTQENVFRNRSAQENTASPLLHSAGNNGTEESGKIRTLLPAYKRTSADVFCFAEKVSVCVQQVIEISLINNSVWENIWNFILLEIVSDPPLQGHILWVGWVICTCGGIKMMEFTITEETLLVVACCVVFVMILLGLGILLTPFFDLWSVRACLNVANDSDRVLRGLWFCLGHPLNTWKKHKTARGANIWDWTRFPRCLCNFLRFGGMSVRVQQIDSLLCDIHQKNEKHYEEKEFRLGSRFSVLDWFCWGAER